MDETQAERERRDSARRHVDTEQDEALQPAADPQFEPDVGDRPAHEIEEDPA